MNRLRFTWKLAWSREWISFVLWNEAKISRRFFFQLELPSAEPDSCHTTAVFEAAMKHFIRSLLLCVNLTLRSWTLLLSVDRPRLVIVTCHTLVSVLNDAATCTDYVKKSGWQLWSRRVAHVAGDKWRHVIGRTVRNIADSAVTCVRYRRRFVLFELRSVDPLTDTFSLTLWNCFYSGKLCESQSRYNAKLGLRFDVKLGCTIVLQESIPTI